MEEVIPSIEVRDLEPRTASQLITEERTSEAMHRVQAMYVLAQKFPRHPQKALVEIEEACKRKSLAEVGLYSFPRGGKTVTGPSIRLAEAMAQAWGNLDYGIRELEQTEGLNAYSIIEAYCSDLEKNNHQRRVFQIFHKRKANRTVKRLDDPRDVYEHVANYGARRMRACILAVIPKYVTEIAEARVRETLSKGGGPLIDRVNKMISAFSDVGVSVELLEKRLQHPANLITEEEMIELRGIYTALRDGEARRQDFFQLRTEPSGGRAAELNDRIQPENTQGE